MSNDDHSDQSRTITYTDYKAGQVLVNIWDSNDKVTVGQNGYKVTLNKGEPKIYVLEGAADQEPEGFI
jgi:hypothetical protein